MAPKCGGIDTLMLALFLREERCQIRGATADGTAALCCRKKREQWERSRWRQRSGIRHCYPRVVTKKLTCSASADEMNPRRVHDLMLRHFPPIGQEPGEWRLLMRDVTCPPELVLALLRETFPSDQVVVEVSRKVGGMFPIEGAAAFIATHVGHAHIRIANRSFTTLAAIAPAGVVTSWRQDADALKKPEARTAEAQSARAEAVPRGG